MSSDRFDKKFARQEQNIFAIVNKKRLNGQRELFMSKETVISAIDVGSDKITTLIASVDNETRQIRVVGSSTVPSVGVLKSVIVDLEAALGAVEQSLNAAERMAGLSIHQAYVSLSGEHIRSQNSTGVVAVANPEKEITSLDIERVIEAARAVSVPPDREILHVIPRYYKVDSQEGIRDPTHMTGVRLEAETHIITGSSTSIRNLKKCLNDLGIEVQGFVFSALGAAEVTLTETEKELGVVLCDIGASASSFCAYVDGAIELSGSIPIGARHITQDIALGCRLDREVAEKVKVYLSDHGLDKIKPLPGESKKEFAKRKEDSDIFNLSQLGISQDKDELSKNYIVKVIMYPRIQEIVTQLGAIMEKEDLFSKTPAGIVFTGGGSLSIDLVEISERIMGLPARIGQPKQLEGMIAEQQSSLMAVATGLLLYSHRQGSGEELSQKFNFSEAIKDLHLDKVGGKAIGLIKKMLP